ncbi:MAG: hypothetical protein ACRD30_01305, partial [Bryobacteraceae bacterium]
MTLDPRHRRAIPLFAVMLILGGIYRFWTPETSSGAPAPAVDSASAAASEQRLSNLRDIAATVPAKEQILKQVSSELATREKGLISASTAAQARANFRRQSDIQKSNPNLVSADQMEQLKTAVDVNAALYDAAKHNTE